MIYSGAKDAYKNKLRSLLEKIMDVLKDPNAHPNLLILVMFCFRILILRLSSQTQVELFRNIWATLLSFLINVFDKHKFPIEKHVNLIYSALKLIEMLSFVQLEEFYLHQWIFVFDCNKNTPSDYSVFPHRVVSCFMGVSPYSSLFWSMLSACPVGFMLFFALLEEFEQILE